MNARNTALRHPVQPYTPPRACLSCGTTANLGRRKYCSVECRQRLRRRLNQYTGLLRALSVRYATFYFTGQVVVLDLIVGTLPNVFSFMFPRTPGGVPADDYGRMADCLGSRWWDECRRTRKRYLASRSLLEDARQGPADRRHVVPLPLRLASVDRNTLIQLDIDRASLDAPDLVRRIKAAYRHQARRHHPDAGGDEGAFLRLHKAYEDLLGWAENPTFIRRRGFPDKWFYEEATNRWKQPIALRRTR